MGRLHPPHLSEKTIGVAFSELRLQVLYKIRQKNATPLKPTKEFFHESHRSYGAIPRSRGMH